MNPFSVPDATADDDDFPVKEQWIALRVNEAWMLEFHNVSCLSFWIARLADTPTLARRALKVLVSFSTSNLCKQGFTAVLGMKCERRNKLDVVSISRLAVSATIPRIPK